MKTQACRRTLRGHTGWVSSLALLGGLLDGTPTNSLIASASWDATIRLWRIRNGTGDDNGEGVDFFDQELQILHAGLGNALYCIGISSNGRTVNVGCRQCQIQQWDIESGTSTNSLLGHSKEVHAIDTNGCIIVSGSGDSTAKLWDARSSECSMTLRGHMDSVMAVQVALLTSFQKFFICSSILFCSLTDHLNL